MTGDDSIQIKDIIFVAVFVAFLVLLFCLSYQTGKATRNAPAESLAVDVVDVRLVITSNSFNGRTGSCSIQVSSNGQLRTIRPDNWHDCERVSTGDRVTIWRQQYALDRKGQWKPWQILE